MLFCIPTNNYGDFTMAVAQSNGSAVTATSTKNDGGVAKYVGSSSVLDNVSVSNPSVGVFGSTVLDNAYADKALSGGVFKYDNLRPISKRVTTTLATVSKPVLQSGALVPGNLRLLHKRESYKVSRIATAIRNGDWNIYTGSWTTPPTSTTESPGTDNAAIPSRTKPGELVYRTGSKLPVRDDYKAKTG
jgi:hypothetical protein